MGFGGKKYVTGRSAHPDSEHAQNGQRSPRNRGSVFTEVTVWKRRRLSYHSVEILGRGSPDLLAFEGETKQTAALPPYSTFPSSTTHFRSARRFRPLPSLPVSLGSAAAGFCVRCGGWFRRAPGVLF